MNAVCPVCRQHNGIEDFTDLRRCPRCDHVFQWPADITADYGHAYVEKYAHYPLAEISHLRIGFVKAFADGGSLLDVGCGRGDFVRAAQQAGFKACGYDVHGVNVGIPMIDDLTEWPHWDVVTFFDSLEHFADLRPLHELFTRAKLIIVAMPFRPDWFPCRREWKHYRPGEHLHYFSERSLRALFSGRKLIRASNVEDAVRGDRNRETNIGTWAFK